MTRDEFEVLSALVDGEAVEPAELERALALPGAHAALVAFARLKRRIAEDPARPAASFEASVRRVLRPRRRLAVLATAAALVLLLVAPVRQALRPGHPVQGPPPVPDLVLRFEPGVDWRAR